MAGASLRNRQLARAARRGEAARCSRLMAAGADPDAEMGPRGSSLWEALGGRWPANTGEQRGAIDAFLAMARASRDPGAPRSDGRRLWEWAASLAFAPALRAMSMAGVDVAGLAGAQLERVSCAAAMEEMNAGGFSNLRWEESLALLLDLGWTPSDASHPAWRLALSNCAYYGRVERVDLLLRRGVPPRAPVEGGAAPLWLAATGADESGSIARALLSAGADVEELGEGGISAGAKARSLGRRAVAEAMWPWELSLRESAELGQMLSTNWRGGPAGERVRL